MTGREAIYQALFDRVKNLPGFVTTSRRPRLAKDVSPEELPALFCEQLPETVQHQGQGQLAKHLLRADLIIYIPGADPANSQDVPSSRLNVLIDAVAAALAPENEAEEQTLEGRVRYCRLDGDLEVNEGVVSGAPLAILPVVMLAV